MGNSLGNIEKTDDEELLLEANMGTKKNRVIMDADNHELSHKSEKKLN